MKRFGYEYVILRYTHDVFSGERLNVAVVLRSSAGDVAFRVPGSFSRVKAAFPDADVQSIRGALLLAHDAIKKYIGIHPESTLSSAILSVIPKDESSLQVGSHGAGMAADLSAAADELLERFILRCECVFEDVVVTENRQEKFGWSHALPRQIHSSNDSFWEVIEPHAAIRA